MSITNFKQVFQCVLFGHMVRIFTGSGYHVGYVDGQRATGYVNSFSPCLSWCKEIVEAV